MSTNCNKSNLKSDAGLFFEFFWEFHTKRNICLIWDALCKNTTKNCITLLTGQINR